MSHGQWNSVSLPKVELHRHLEGALRFSTVLELARNAGMDVPEDRLSAQKMFLVEEPMVDLGTVLKKFLNTQKLLSSEEILSRITFEAIEDAYEDGIRILELRYAPTFIAEGHPHLDYKKIHRAILKGAELANKFPVAVGFICIFQRILPLETSKKVLHFFLDHRQDFIGADLADDEAFRPAKDFSPLFQELVRHNVPITIHAGEALIPEAAQNVMDSLEILGARRIGHGLQIVKSPQALKKVIAAKVPLEICPTSNYLTQAIPDLQSHPINQLRQAGVLVTVNSDDPGIFNYKLSDEYNLLHRHYGWSESDFTKANQIAFDASFIPNEIKNRFWPSAKRSL
ncbi:MAG: adenosine deaminase [Pseudobdellovibrionaceae bacterium]